MFSVLHSTGCCHISKTSLPCLESSLPCLETSLPCLAWKAQVEMHPVSCMLCLFSSPDAAGVTPGQFKYVEVLDVTAVRVEPFGCESAWNVDGELLANNHVTAQVHKGLLEIFARGVEGIS